MTLSEPEHHSQRPINIPTDPNIMDPPPDTDTHNEANSPSKATEATLSPPNQPPLRIYTRSQILFLHNSPLVKPPPNMPDLKSWFGETIEQPLSKKDPDPPVSRDRRFRRDAEDNDSPSKSSLRTGLTQPSQMGNFKHHSIRASDRGRDGDRDRDKDRDRDDKERERDIREKEGQERLRNLSDKYDRERMAAPSGNRHKDREVAPHLNATSTARANPQTQLAAGTSRREPRESGKKKAGESSEDWRRGAEPPRNSRDDRSDGRKDREERDRARESSRPRRDISTSRREREGGRDDRDRRDRDDKDRDRRADRNKERDDRDRDADRDLDADDPRRWRDDGKRDERMAVRRGDRAGDRENRDKDRPKDRAAPENSWETPSDRRWTVVEERDGRSKRQSARDRKSGQAGEETGGREDRREREREREREKEKEPAWMDTYIPTSTSGGILGGKGADNELDGIQAWKKGMKEKELKDKPPADQAKAQTEVPDKQLDEIQLFRLLMKKEEEKKKDPNETQTVVDVKGRVQPAVLSGSLLPTPSVTAATPLSNSASEHQNQVGTTVSVIAEPSDGPSFQAPPTQERTPTTEQTPSPQFNPPSGSRLLAFARASSANSRAVNANNGVSQNLNGRAQDLPIESLKLSQASVSLNQAQIPAAVAQQGLDQPKEQVFASSGDAHRPASALASVGDGGLYYEAGPQDSPTGYASNKGSRFARFFDGKPKDSAPKVQPQFGVPTTQNQTTRQEPAMFMANGSDQRTMDDIYAMLSNSAQGQRLGGLGVPNGQLNNASFVGHPQNLQQHIHQQQQLQPNNRMEPLYESRLDDRNFMPDGMVPGLRSVPPPRGRDGMFADNLDEGVHFNGQRLPLQRALEPLYPGPPQQMFSQQGGRNGSIPQQPTYRGGPSPNLPPIHNPQAQRLPPGLANLGGRPPHDPSSYIGMGGGPSGGLHNQLLSNLPAQQPFNGINNSSNFSGMPPMRAGPTGLHPMQHPLSHHQSGPLGLPGNLDPRSHNALLTMNNGGVRNIGTGYPTQGGLNGQMQTPHPSLRQQQQPHQPQMHPHHVPHLLPPHLQQQQNISMPNNQPAHDLMALLMGGSLRE